MTANLKPTIAIVGAGLAGGLLAEELGKWADVTVFERGRALATKPGRPISDGHPLGLYPSYGYGLGGTTNLWHGGLLAMHPKEYGEHWPDGMPNEIERYHRKMVQRLYGEEWLRSWKALRADNEQSPPFLDVIIKPHPRFRIREARCFSRADLRLGYHVQKVEDAGDKVILYVRGRGSTEPFVFDLAVISAGGVNSPLLLRRSNIGGENVGENITDHPIGFVAKMTRGSDPSRFNRLVYPLPDTEPMLKIYDEKTSLWSAFYLRPTRSTNITNDPYAASFETLGFFDRLGKKISGLLPYPGLHAYVVVFSEQEARGQGSVREDASGGIHVDWVVSDAVVSAIDRSLDKLADWLGGTLHRAGDIRNRLWCGAHHSGGCRIADDPKMGVVDSNLQVHGTKRIFVCDGSVLPSTGATNTGLTIGALAFRLAVQLAPRSPLAPRPAAPRTFPSVLISGVTGHVGRMIEPVLTRRGIPTTTLDVRVNSKAVEVEKASILVHLANARDSWPENVKLQQMTADAVNAAGIMNVIVPMSFATLEVPTQIAGDPEAFNLGFMATMRSDYVIGKLKSEEFWLKWQKESPGRCLQFLYVPAILGPNSAWTQSLARYCFAVKIWVPRIPQFFTVEEEKLIEVIVNLCQAPSLPGVSRHVVVSHCGSLAEEAIAADLGRETVQEFKLPGPIWWLFSLTKRGRRLGAALWLSMRLVDKVLWRGARQAFLPILPDYYALFLRQSHFDRTILAPRI